ncbi:DUF2188 domain-containing protein [Stutzerimonas azotifigens]|uniref:DUF2188 domain-containing protein n=1 Tax=Stutzerimonas azotifigens TaxID=291995 RepID=A0ABR5YX11_9GAMM|nr:DUF2188 domain-containing protein [Stutzerimonas azotifigens]MBA1272472.1 DUF2188 domain-containing protein [Stutzerimonas azotifigens]
MQNYHVKQVDAGWALLEEGSERAVLEASTKEELVRQVPGYMAGKVGSVKIHRADGTFEEERTYPRAADPTQSPG